MISQFNKKSKRILSATRVHRYLTGTRVTGIETGRVPVAITRHSFTESRCSTLVHKSQTPLYTDTGSEHRLRTPPTDKNLPHPNIVAWHCDVANCSDGQKLTKKLPTNSLTIFFSYTYSLT